MKEETLSGKYQLTRIESKVLSELRVYGINSIIIGLSGGADSTCLLRSLATIRETEMPDLKLTAVHCNFHLRGEESDRDEKFCQNLCLLTGVELRVFQCPVEEWRKFNSGSDEIACREMRYARFRDVLSEINGDVIAVAHNSDDQVETFLLNLMRGSGSTGLRGMQPLKNGIFRPLLDISREDIVKYLRELNQEYITDSTNLQSLYRRNYLRNRVIPLLEKEWPEAKESILKSVEILSRENRIIDFSIRNLIPEGCLSLSADAVREFPDPETLFIRFLSPYGVSSSLVKEIASTIRMPYSGRHWPLGNGAVLWEERTGWSISTGESEEVPQLQREVLPFSEELMKKIKVAPLTECWTDEDADLEWRLHKRGDRIRPLGMKGSRLVRDILSENHVSNREKQNLYVLALPSSNEVIWIPSLKRSRHLLVTNPRSVYRFKLK